MTTNEEIINKHLPTGLNWTDLDVSNLMNLARVDERDKEAKVEAHTHVSMKAFDKGYELGCQETKEKTDKFIEEWRDHFYHNVDGCEGDANRMLNDWKELSCPENNQSPERSQIAVTEQGSNNSTACSPVSAQPLDSLTGKGLCKNCGKFKAYHNCWKFEEVKGK